MRKKRTVAKKSRKATCGTSAGAPLMLRASRDPSDRMQPISAKFSSSTVGFCVQMKGISSATAATLLVLRTSAI